MKEMNEWQTIKKNQPRAEILAQLAEECAELSQAALKLRRVLTGVSATPVAMEDAEYKMCEEIADVITCIELAGDYLYDVSMDDEIRDIHDRKLRRWARRVRATGEDETS